MKYLSNSNKSVDTKSKKKLVELLDEGILSENQEEALKEILSKEYIFLDENKSLKKETGEIRQHGSDR